MTDSVDFPGEMDRFPNDFRDAEAVFGASPGSDSVPDHLRDVAELVHAARRVGSSDELVGQEVVVAQIAAAIGEHAALPPGNTNERTHVLLKLRTAKLTAAATAVLMLGATAAAAETGTLPSPIQRSVAKGLAGVGISIPAHHRVELAVKHSTPPAHAHHAGTKHAGTKPRSKHPLAKDLIAHHHHRKHLIGAVGVVASVNDVTDPKRCGGEGAPGTFTLTGSKGMTFTVKVDTTTAYLEKDVTSPSFANVCVGEFVAGAGTLDGSTVTATKVFIAPVRHEQHRRHHGVFGTVASVNNSSDPSTCGTGTAGTFTLTDRLGATFTVNVDRATKLFAPGVSDPSFVNVCVGAKVGAEGDITGTTIAAAKVFVAPTHADQDRGNDPGKDPGKDPGTDLGNDLREHHGDKGHDDSTTGDHESGHGPGPMGLDGEARQGQA